MAQAVLLTYFLSDDGDAAAIVWRFCSAEGGCAVDLWSRGCSLSLPRQVHGFFQWQGANARPTSSLCS